MYTICVKKLRSLNNLFFKETKIVIFVYDITRNSLEFLKNYLINEINEKLGTSIIKGIWGNKTDLYLKEKVSEEEGKKSADSIGAKFTETSAKDDSYSFIYFLEKLIINYIKNSTFLEKIDESKI